MMPDCILVEYNKEDKENMLYVTYNTKEKYNAHQNNETVVRKLIDKFPALSQFGVTSSFDANSKIDYIRIKCKHKHSYRNIIDAVNIVSVIPSQLL